MSSVDREYAITQYKVRLQLNSGSSMRLGGASVGHSRRGSTRERKAQQSSGEHFRDPTGTLRAELLC